MKGVVFQTSTMITAISAVSGEAVQAIGSAIRPIASSTWLITPNTSWSIQPHICAETTVGIAQGISTAARNRPRPPKWALSASAIAMPSTVSMVTEKVANTTVFQTAFHQSGSEQEIDVVDDADELGRAEVGQIGVGEAEPDGAGQRPAGDQGQHHEHRRQEQPGRAHPLAGQPRGLLLGGHDLFGSDDDGAHGTLPDRLAQT